MLIFNLLINGLHKSGRTTKILNLISKQEGLEITSLLKSPDFKIIDFRETIDYIEEVLHYLANTNPLQLSNNYCIVKNIDFSTSEKQEVYLKYLEDSSIKFYFTSYNINKIESKALISRLKIINHQLSCSEYLTEQHKIMYNQYLNLSSINSLIDLEFASIFSKDIKNILKFDHLFYSNLEDFKNKLSNYEYYPLWFTLEIVYKLFHTMFISTYKRDKSIMTCYNKLTNTFIALNITNVNSLYCYINVCYIHYNNILILKASKNV